MDSVTLEMAGAHVALVTIQRPEARNAVNGAVATGLDRIVKHIEKDSNIWVAVLTGAGGAAFCAGADLKEVSAGRMDDLYTPDGAFAGFVKHPRDKLWIAAVEGFALAFMHGNRPCQTHRKLRERSGRFRDDLGVG